MRREDFNTGVEEQGLYKGRRYIEIVANTKNTKTERLSLKQTTFTSSSEEHRYHEDLDDEWDFVKLFHHYNDNCLPPPEVEMGFDNRFFRRVAPNKVLKKRRKKGIKFTAGLEKGQVLGKNYFNELMSQIAKECKLTNPEKQKAASLRSEHICTLVNAKDTIDAKTIIASSRQKTEAAHNVYKHKSHIQLDKKKVFHAEKRNIR